MSPPELARDAPVVNVLQPVAVDFGPRNFGDEARTAPSGERLERRACHLVHATEPLRRDQRLDHRAAPIATRDGEFVILDPFEQPKFAEALDHTLARFIPVQSGELRSCRFGHARVLVHDDDVRQVVSTPHLVVVRIMRRRDLDRARAEVRVNRFVGDDRDLAPDERQNHRLADQLAITFVVRIDRHRRVAEHGLGARGGDRDAPIASFDRILQVVELALKRLLFNFEIGKRRLILRTPVDDVIAAVDQSLFV